MKIGALARCTGTAIETIRYYERVGLLPKAARSSGNYRVYDQTHAERLTFIRHCRALDLGLTEIRQLLHCKDAPTQNCGTVCCLLDAHIRQVKTRIETLQTLQTHLKTLRARCTGSKEAARCRILNQLAHADELVRTSKSARERSARTA